MKASRSVHFESLEGRTLLSGWSTVEDFAPGDAAYENIASDAAGNIYAVGYQSDSSGVMHGIIREKPAGSASFSTVLDYTNGPYMNFNALAVSSGGDVYVGGAMWGQDWVILRRRAGETGFQLVERFTSSAVEDLAIDAAGNVFSAGQLLVTVTKVGPGNKTTTTNSLDWVVRKCAAGQSSFATVDDFGKYNDPQRMICVNSGPSAGIYVAGETDFGPTGTAGHWIVRKSSNAGSTWSTVDNYQYDTSGSSFAHGITADASGNLYAAGMGSKHVLTGGTKQHPTYTDTSLWIVRKSADGGASWSVNDSFQAGTNNEPCGMGTDLAGNVYIAGQINDASGTPHSVIRSNLGGWQTVDDFQLAPAWETVSYGFARDPNGDLYAAGYGVDAAGAPHAIIRSTASAAAAPVAANAFPSQPIASSTFHREVPDLIAGGDTSLE